MSRRQIDFPPEDQPFADDLDLLDGLVSEVVREQGGERILEALGSSDPARVRNLDTEQAEQLCRASSTRLRMIDLVERAHRIRLRRETDRPDSAPSGSWLDVIARLHEDGVELDALLHTLSELTFEPIFTAHPTEATRRSLLRRERRIVDALVQRFTVRQTPGEARSSVEQIRSEISTLWQTEPQPKNRPSIRDQQEQILHHLGESVFPALPTVVDNLLHALATVYGLEDSQLDAFALPDLLHCGSWVGGDMDGNPYVTADTLKTSLARHRQTVLELYAEEAESLAARLSQSETRVAVDPEVHARILEYKRLIPEIAEQLSARDGGMPYRILLQLLAGRLRRTHAGRTRKEGAYADVAELTRDLSMIRKSLDRHLGRRAGSVAIGHLEHRTRAFGFHLASLYQRQDSALHREVLGHLLIDDRWMERPVSSRLRRVRQMLGRAKPRVAPPGSPAVVHQSLAVFRVLAEARRHGMEDKAFGPYAVSMTEGPDDVLSILLLARWGGLIEDDEVPLDVAPLFETLEDLEHAAETLEQLLDLPIYQQHLARRGGRQTVMLGYADVNKDGGHLAGRLASYHAQIAMKKVAAARPEVELHFFHGPGCSIHRNPEQTRRAMLDGFRNTLSNRLSSTEPGEILADRFGLREVAAPTVEEAVGAALEGRLSSHVEPPLTQLVLDAGEAAREAYQELIFGERKLYRYFRLATPIDVIERLMIGNRPASRRIRAGIANLRAVPWILAWTQSRHGLPGWYGIGSALEKAIELHGRDAVSETVLEGPFLNRAVADAEAALARSNMEIAALFAELAGDIGKPIFPRIRAEWELAVELILELKGQERLLEDDPPLRRSIDLRLPEVDAVSRLQVDLLRRWREGGREDEQLLKLLLSTVHGVTRGLESIL